MSSRWLGLVCHVVVGLGCGYVTGAERSSSQAGQQAQQTTNWRRTSTHFTQPSILALSPSILTIFIYFLFNLSLSLSLSLLPDTPTIDG
jgi:hypothetical protein